MGKLNIGAIPGWRSESWVRDHLDAMLMDDEKYTLKYVKKVGLWYYYIDKKDGKRD